MYYYAVKRIGKIFIPFYLAWLFMMFVMFLAGCMPNFAGISKWTFVFTLLGIDGYIYTASGIPNFYIGVGEWFLGCLILLYVLFPLLRIALLKNKWLTMGGACLYYVLVTLFFPFGNMSAYTSILVKGIDFLIGMFLALEFEKIKKWSLCFSVPVMLLLISDVIPLPFLYAWKVELLCLAVFLFFLQLEPVFGKMKGIMKKVTGLSPYMYSVFLVHHILINLYGNFSVTEQIGARAVLFLLAGEMAVIFLAAILLDRISNKALSVLYRK